MPKLYIDDFVGVSNKLESLPMAFAIRKEYGHEIILDWPELDSFSVMDTCRGKVRGAAGGRDTVSGGKRRNGMGPFVGKGESTWSESARS